MQCALYPRQGCGYSAGVGFLEVGLLGGFDVRCDGAPIKGFESRKARALLAYLLLHRTPGGHSRERLAALLWPEADGDTGRQNLRQALYNIRRVLEFDDRQPFLTTNTTVAWDPAVPVALDVAEFEECVARGMSSAGVCTDPAALERAGHLYGGDLLAGLTVDDSPELEEWLLLQQERLRDAALAVFRCLAGFFQSRGDVGPAVQYARRRVEMDQLSEEAHRDLIRLYAQAGQRSRALAQYEHCRHLLGVELGVAPLQETVAVFEEVAAAERTPVPREEESHQWPLLALVGRRDEMSGLRRVWERVAAGTGHMTLITGREGSGKSRLARSAAHDSASRSRALVLAARAFAGVVPVPYGILTGLMRACRSGQEEVRTCLEEGLARGELAPLAGLLPGGASPHSGEEGPPREDVTTALATLLLRLTGLPGGAVKDARRPVIVLLDDLQWADAASVQVLESVRRRVREAPVWLLCVATGEWSGEEGDGGLLGPGAPGGLMAGEPVVAALARWADESVVLEALPGEAVGQLLAGIYEGPDRDELAARLLGVSGGLPLALAEWINLLCDEGVLLWGGGGRWVAGGEGLRWWETAPESMAALTRRRVARLPSSTRRLLVLAAVMGAAFDADMLAEAADEHPTVLETGLGLLLERCLIRHAPLVWFESRRERDMELWRRGARRGVFEFAHRGIQPVLYDDLSPVRRRLLHSEVASVLTRRFADTPGWSLAQIGQHHLAAEQWQPAMTALEGMARWALSLGVPEAAVTHLETAAITAGRLAEAGTTGAERRTWLSRRRALMAEAARLRPRRR